jgi:hypothetical protein
MFLFTRRRAAVVTPHQMRSYARDSVRTNMDLDFHGGLAFRLILYNVGAPARDTVFYGLSFRDMLTLGPELRRLEPNNAEEGGVRVRSRSRGGPVRIERRGGP